MHLQLPLIKSDRLIIRMATMEDVPLIISYYSENKTFFTPFYPAWTDNFFTQDYWQLQVEVNLRGFRNGSSLRLCIFPKNNPNRVIGVINFSNFVRGVAQYCTVGYSLAQSYQGNGYMQEAMEAAIIYVFQHLYIHRIMANYMPHNRRSANLLKKLGFVVEGYARDYIMINGEWEDHILTSLINHSFIPNSYK
jgi:[ribosomal protein S5]-alanine N-acetyltransferase